MEIREVKRMGRPKGTLMGIDERLKRYRLSERCAEFTDEAIDFWQKVARNKPIRDKEGNPLYNDDGTVMRRYTVDDQFKAIDRMMDRAYGRAPQPMHVDQDTRELSIKKIIHEVQWLPPDPNDTSNYIPPEPD
jgi:hypothetical protein